MNDPAVFTPPSAPPEKQPEAESSYDWRHAPRWVLVTALLFAAAFIAYQQNKLNAESDAATKRVEAAVHEARTLHQERLVERVAIVETQVEVLQSITKDLAGQLRANGNLTSELSQQLRAQREATAELTAQIRIFVQEVRQWTTGQSSSSSPRR